MRTSLSNNQGSSKASSQFVFCNFPLTEIHVHNIHSSGFKDVATETMNVIFNFGSPQDYTRFNQATAAPIHAMFAHAMQERKEEIWNFVTTGPTATVGLRGHYNLDQSVL